MSTTTTTSPKAKIYHLIDNGESSMEIYTRINANQRVRSGNRRNDRPLLQVTYTDAEGMNKTIRFKLNCNSIYQDEQIEKFKIPANERFSDAERSMLEFKNGVLVIANKVAQQFLDNHPENENFKGQCLDIQKKLFREYDPEAKKTEEVLIFKRRLEAANKVNKMDLSEAQDMLLRLFGNSYVVPDKLDDCVIQLISYMDDADDSGIEEILREGKTLQDEINILIGKAVKNGTLSFSETGMENFVVRKKGTQVIPLKEISANLPEHDRRRIFSEFLASNDGVLHLQDLRNLVGADDTKTKESEDKKQVAKQGASA